MSSIWQDKDWIRDIIILEHLVLQFILHECIKLGQLNKEFIKDVQHERLVVDEHYIRNNVLVSTVD